MDGPDDQDRQHDDENRATNHMPPPSSDLVRHLRTKTSNLIHGTDFNVARYAEVMRESNFRELTPSDLHHVEKLYKKNEMRNSIFFNLAEGAWTDADAEAMEGGYADRWHPSAIEMEALLEHCPSYISSGDEFKQFLEGSHGRPGARFRAFGVFSDDGKYMRAMSAAFVPSSSDPSDPRYTDYADRIVRIFRGNDEECKFIATPNFDLSDLEVHAPTTAEWYIVGVDGTPESHGAATIAFHRMLEKLELEKVKITKWFLYHYSAFNLLQPNRDDEPDVTDSPNGPSRVFCHKRKFRDCGYADMPDQVAAREIEGHGVVVVRPTWKIMWGNHGEVMQASQGEFSLLASKGIED